ncbi:replication protein A 70 kDa DNA-binding subunit-like isoform X3 [Schistocerca gregaria]|uniref:replication protein A 70 kDa DNA-binding subunit-like isoform X3 n=1 Tax=Schistocerca gregaria TaxID=7010 RepID=UPI00211F1432|nr:replication protein A 70 kDa DNA-binding subunit-like isoform X3 [Schistocerca gregaria]
MKWQLTEGALATIMRGGTVEGPVMQILGSGRIDGAESSERYHLQVSDSCHQNSAVLATELKDKLASGELSEYSVVRLNRWMFNSGERGTERVIVIVDLTILASGTEVGVKIGEPVPFREDSSTGAACDEQSAQPVLSPPALSQPQEDDTTGSTCGSILRIADLSPDQKEWEIKARVVNKTAIKQYNKGEGKRFSMELVDNSGHIHATAFGKQCDEFYDLIEVGRVYFISRDVIGVVKDTGSVEVVTVRKRNEQEKKREVTIVDESDTTVKLTLWGKQAEEFSVTPGSVLAVKGAKQSNFGGRRSVLVQMWSTVKVNPDVPETQQLRDWYHRQEHVNISTEQLDVAGTAEYTPPQPKQKICPVAKLSPYRKEWRIEARVVNKTRIQSCPNESGDRKLFSMEFVDKSGEILATAFDEQCYIFYDLIEEERVYSVSKCRLKPANKILSSVNHDYQMIFTKETTVVSRNEDDVNIPRHTFHFKPLNNLPDIDLAALVDIIGVVNTIGSVEVVTVRATNKEEKKCDITIVDQSNTTMKLTLWGEQAEEFSVAPGSVLAVKGAKQSDFRGQRSASVLRWSTVKVNPDIPEAHKLRDWYHQLEHDNISTEQPEASGFQTEGYSDGHEGSGY